MAIDLEHDIEALDRGVEKILSLLGLADQAATFQRGLRSLSEGVRLVGR
jgi:hypothetical protein